MKFFILFYFILSLLLIQNFCHNFHKQLPMKYFSVHLSVFFFFFQFSISAWRLKWSEHSPLDEPLWVCLLSYFNHGTTHRVIQFISSSEKFEVLPFGFVHVIDAKKRGGKETLMSFFFFFFFFKYTLWSLIFSHSEKFKCTLQCQYVFWIIADIKFIRERTSRKTTIK